MFDNYPLILALLFFVAVIFLLLQIVSLKDRLQLVRQIDQKTKSLLAILSLKDLQSLSASAALLQIFGISDEELKKHNFKEFIHPDDAKLLNTVITNSLGDEKKYAGKSIENLRVRLRDARYGWQWYELFGFFTSFRAKAIFCCSFFPINEQIRIHEELIEHKRLMNILLNNSWAIVWKMDCLSRRLTLLTPVSKERFGIDDFPAGPIISNVDVFTPESLSKIRQELNERIASLADSGKVCDSPQRSVITVQNKDGSRVDLEICSTLEKNDIGFYTLYGVSQLLSKK